MKYCKNYSLRFLNSFRLSSIVEQMWFPETNKEYIKLIKEEGPIPILGGGTNVLLQPTIEKLVSLRKLPKKTKWVGNTCIVPCNYSTTAFIQEAIDKNCMGLEWLWGIPGQVGGAIVMNAGSGKQTITDYLKRVTVIDKEGNLRAYKKEELELERRSSIFQTNKETLLSAIFEFKTGKICTKSLNKNMKYRTTLPKYPNAGGIFKNWHALKPISCQIIGSSIGGAEVSKFPNIIINKNKAQYKDIIDLISIIKTKVDVSLELEVKII